MPAAASAILISALMFIGTAICGAMPSFGWNLAMCFLMGASAGGLEPLAQFLAQVPPASGLASPLVQVSSATALTSALLPILIAVLQTLPGDFSRLGMTMALGFVVSYGFILPINAPQNMVCLGTETFNARQFAKVGIVVTLVGYGLMLVFAATWWHWLGWM